MKPIILLLIVLTVLNFAFSALGFYLGNFVQGGVNLLVGILCIGALLKD